METRILITSGTTALLLLTHNMGHFLDILSGRIFRFRKATGDDINAGSSDELIVTPQALSKSDAFSNASIPLALPASFSTRSSSFVLSDFVFVVPTNGFFYSARKAKLQAQLFVFANAEAGSEAEVCVVDAQTAQLVNGSTFQLSNISFECKSSKVFEIDAGKLYTIALRRSSGISSKAVNVRAATLTLKLLSA
jgi:hypothetical protein